MVTGGPTAGPGPAPCVVTPAPTPPPGSAAAAAAASTSPAPDVGGGPIAVQRRSASETRRSNKPIMEKRRRARINNCLNELKTLILDAMKKDPARHSKLEKADILEMTVKHLESLQRQQSAMAAATDPSVVNKFRAGFSECAGEVGRFPGLEANVRRRLLSHLASCLNGSAMAAQAATAAAQAASVHDHHQQQQQQQPANTAGVTAAPTQQVTAMPVTAAPTTATATAVQVHIVPAVGTSGEHATGPLLLTTAGAVSAGGLQLLPTRLPNGDIALVLPRSQLPQPQQQQPSQQQQQQQGQQQSTPTVLPTLVPIPTRTASTASAASSTSSMSSVSSASSSPSGSASGSSSASVSPVAFERLAVNSSPPAPPLVSPPAPTVVVAAPPMVSSPVPPTPPAPTSPVVLCRDVATSPANLYYQPRPYSPPMQKPLSLVVRKTAQPVEEEKPWRPW
ncbi:protein hairy [Schistocerca cancellata]|uniref:protein hairy n=1 Tax=Schistocerca cancellata TaxID=274614 RepID=UPI0021198A39|nr:protein hairy [Schistocerca cancellata]